MFDRRQKINLACALICFGMLGYAIFTPRKYLGFIPCPLCMFQRVCIGALGLVFLIAGLHRARYVGAVVYGVFIFLPRARRPGWPAVTCGSSTSHRARCRPVARRSTACCRCFRCSRSSARS